MRSFTGLAGVVALALALVAGLLIAVHAQADSDGPPGTVHAGDVAYTSPVTVTETYTMYHPLAVKSHYGFLIFVDDFSDPTSGWYVGEMPGVRWSYQSGEYEILITSGPAWAAVTAPAPAVDDYGYEFDVRRSGGTGNLYGVIFGWVDWDHYYVFVVAPDVQYYGVFQKLGTGWLPVVDWATSGHILPGDASNHLRVERSLSQLTVYANGNELVTTTNSAYTGPLKVGLYAEADVAVPLATRFDDVVISRLDGARVQVGGASWGADAWVGGLGAAGLGDSLRARVAD